MSLPRPVLVVDFGAQYAQLIARRVREAKVYSEIVPHSMPVAEMLAKDPAAIILSGGPSSVYEPGAPQVDPKLFDAGVPVFGICYGFQAMAAGARRRRWRTPASASSAAPPLAVAAEAGVLLRDLPAELPVWMSHGDCVTRGAGRLRGDRRLAGRAGGRVRGPGRPAGRRAVPPRGGAHRARAGGADAVPLRHRRHRADLDQRATSSTSRSPRSGPRSATRR